MAPYSFTQTGGGGTGVNVYIIDTGIYPGHEYFTGRAQVGFDSFSDGQEVSDIFHPTHGSLSDEWKLITFSTYTYEVF